ncbi:MAG TPA: carboxypeptidase regulatory-like domain-containing protein, partial [Longimicrobiales bacterium]|nr:carboxypeptidase regulatory-like domain-containing protein [Longimicrobiales bacterium]
MSRAWSLLIAAVLWLPAPAGAQSVELYQQACDGGDRTACAVFARMLELGEGVIQDQGRALDLYARACDAEHVEACTRLGLMYEEGRGAPPDVRRARAYYWIACDAGDRLGCDLIATTAVMHSALTDSLSSKRIRAIDATTSGGLPQALVELPGLGIRAATDPDGELMLRDLPRGQHVVRVSRLGYQPLEGLLEVPGDHETVARLSPSTARTATAPGRIRGRITDEQGAALDLVEVSVVGPDGPRTVTDESGGFTLDDVEPGLVELRFTRLGYAPRTVPLVLQPDAGADVSATMATQAIELEPIQVTAEARSDFLELRGFYDRARVDRGLTLTREEIWERAPTRISDMILGRSGIRIQRSL